MTRDVEQPLADARARERARTLFDQPLILEAGAGTGKTATLVARILTWCLGPGFEKARQALCKGQHQEPSAAVVAARVAERVVAITFTEKAAAEMAARIMQGLSQILRGEEVLGLPVERLHLEPRLQKARARALLGAAHRMPLGTIHAFCRRLLAKNPLAAGLNPAFEVDPEGTALRAAIDELLAERLGETYGDPTDPHLMALARAGHGPEALAELLEDILRTRWPLAALEEDYTRPERVERCRQRLLKQLAPLLDLLSKAFTAIPPKRLKNSVLALEQLQQFAQHVQASPPAWKSFQEQIETHLQDEVMGELKKWAAGDTRKGTRDSLQEHFQELAPLAAPLQAQLKHLQQTDLELLNHACLGLLPLVREARQKLKRQGVEGFSDLLHDAVELLEDNPPLARSLRQRFDQILIDEFQDTDPLQYSLVRHLALSGPQEQRPGLFLVGDPKQSIYGWRQADLEAYARFKRRVAKSGEVLSLWVNFRSVPAILQEVERVIAPVMLEEEGRQPAFQPLLACPAHATAPGFCAAGRRPVEYWAVWPDDPRHGTDNRLQEKLGVQEAREMEAQALARDLLDLHQQELLRFGDVALILRATTSQETYLGALREAGIPYVVERDRRFYQRREVIEAAALVRSVIDPNDHVALLAFLRSPMVGLPDGALIPLWREGLPEEASRLAAPNPESLAALDALVERARRHVKGTDPGVAAVGGWSLCLRHGLRALAHLRASLQRDPADRFVELLFDWLLPAEMESARFLGLHRLANLERFRRRLLELLMEDQAGLQGLLKELRLSTGEAQEEPEGAPSDESLDAVSVMSIHRAKGLGFQHVYLLDLHHGYRNNALQESCCAWVLGQYELSLCSCPSLDLDLCRERRAAIQEAEHIRTLYVAMTRPAQRLVLSGRWPADLAAAENNRSRPRHALDIIARRQGGFPDPAELWDHGGGSNAKIDQAGVLWRVLPRKDEAAGEARRTAGRRGSRQELAETAVVAQAQATLNEAARAARQRQNRPWILTPSAALPSKLELAEGSSETPVVPLSGRASRQDPNQGGLVGNARVARATGTAIHRILETCALAAPLATERERLTKEACSFLAAALPPALVGKAQARLEELLQQLWNSRLFARFLELAPHILAREMPFLMHPKQAPPSPAEEAVLGAIVGTLDLLYRDPESGKLVAADYKTDAVTSPGQLSERLCVHAPQGVLYQRALEAAFPQEELGPFEFWFWQADTILPLGL